MPTAMPDEPLARRLGKRRRQDHRLFVLAVIGGAEIHRILVQTLQQGLGGFGETAFGVAHGGGVIAIDIAEIALAFDQGITQREILGETHQRLVDRHVAMGMIFADYIAHHAGAFLETGGGIEAQQPHGMQQPAMDRLQPVARIGQRPLGDGGERIGQIALGQRPRQRLGADIVFFDFSGGTHKAVLVRFAAGFRVRPVRPAALSLAAFRGHAAPAPAPAENGR